MEGSSTSASFWERTAMNESLALAFFTTLRLASRLTVTEHTTPGKSTMLRKAKAGSEASNSVESNCFISPLKSDMSEKDRNLLSSFVFITLRGSVCGVLPMEQFYPPPNFLRLNKKKSVNQTQKYANLGICANTHVLFLDRPKLFTQSITAAAHRPLPLKFQGTV